MKHAIGYLGWYERSFPRLKAGDYKCLLKDGSVSKIDERPRNVDGVFFGYMECAGKKFVAVRAEHGGYNVVVSNPVPLKPKRHTDGKGFGPNPSRFSDASAERLLIDMIAANPNESQELRKIADRLGWRTTEAG
jgi:hypothetical protein